MGGKYDHFIKSLLLAGLLALIGSLTILFAVKSVFGAEITIEAEGMDLSNCATCLIIENGVLIRGEHSISNPVDFQSGNTQFVVTARGELAADEWPIMKIMVGDQIIASVTVSSADWKEYILTGFVSAGNQVFSLSFMNDYWDTETGEDRNLAIDKTVISTIETDPSDQSKIRVSWDAAEESEGIDIPEGYRVFISYQSGSYDYSSPMPTDKFPDGNIIDQLYGDITVNAPNNQTTTFYIVVRSFKGTTMSESSDEVFLTIDKTQEIVLISPGNVQAYILVTQ